jgi:hypothetical protein
MAQYDLPSEKKTHRANITPELMRAIKKIESGGNPNARTGSYKGSYQLSDSEFKRLGGRGDIFNDQENTRIAALKLQQEADQVSAKLGRPLTPGEIYLVHQQGVGGATAHLTNPNQRAWQSMHSTGEGRSKGEKWSRLAIWGNVPDKDKARYGNVENLTSGEFAKMWSDRIARGGGGGGGETAALNPPPLDPTPNVGSGEAGYQPQVAEAPAGTGGIGSDAARAPEQYETTPTVTASTLGKKIGGAAEGVFDDFSKLYAAQAKDGYAKSSPANLPVQSAPTPTPVSPIMDPRMVDAQRQQLALALQRLNSGKLV